MPKLSNRDGDSDLEGGAGAGIDGRAGDRDGGDAGFNGDETLTVEPELEDESGGGVGTLGVITDERKFFPSTLGEADGGVGEESDEARFIIGMAAKVSLTSAIVNFKHCRTEEDMLVHTYEFQGLSQQMLPGLETSALATKGLK